MNQISEIIQNFDIDFYFEQLKLFFASDSVQQIWTFIKDKAGELGISSGVIMLIVCIFSKEIADRISRIALAVLILGIVLYIKGKGYIQ